MLALKPPPEADDIDEPAARRAIRRLTIVLGAFFLAAMIAGASPLVLRRLDHRPPVLHESNPAPAWVKALLVAFVVLMSVTVVWGIRRTHRRPAYRRVMQYGWRRRRLVTKDLQHGRPVSAEDMPVAAALMNLQRSQGRWVLVALCLLPVNSLIQGFIQHGPLRWFQFGIAAFLVVVLPYSRHEQRKIMRNYEKQTQPVAPTNDDGKQ